MNIFWISPLVEIDEIWRPLALELAQASGPVEIKWETTSGNINLAPDGKRYAVGVADVDTTQQAALEGNPDVITLEIANRGRAGRNIPPPLRMLLDALVSRICGDAPSGDDENQDELLTRLINRALGTFRDDRIDVLLKLKDISVPPQAKSGQTILFRDSFTVGADTDIASYPSAGDPDYAYVSGVGSPGDLTVNAANDRVEITVVGSPRSFVLIDASAPTGDQDVVCRGNTVASAGQSTAAAARHSTSTNDLYRVQFNDTAANEVEIVRTDAGTPTTIASADRGLSGTATRFFRMRATGTGATVSTLVQIDGTSPLTFDDTAANRKTSGNPGGRLPSSAIGTFWFDDLQATDAAAQRMYFPETEVAAVSPTVDAAWEHTAGVFRRLLTGPDTSTLTSTAYNPDAGAHEVTGDSNHRSFVSDPLDGDQIIMGRFEAQVQGFESSANANLFVTYGVRVVSNDGSSVRGTLLSVTRDSVSEMQITSIRNQRLPLTNLTPVSALNGDRVAVEAGVGGVPAGAGNHNHNATLRWGCSASGGDLPEDNTETGTTLRPWCEFVTSLKFQQWPLIEFRVPGYTM